MQYLWLIFEQLFHHFCENLKIFLAFLLPLFLVFSPRKSVVVTIRTHQDTRADPYFFFNLGVWTIFWYNWMTLAPGSWNFIDLFACLLESLKFVYPTVLLYYCHFAAEWNVNRRLKFPNIAWKCFSYIHILLGYIQEA